MCTSKKSCFKNKYLIPETFETHSVKFLSYRLNPRKDQIQLSIKCLPLINELLKFQKLKFKCIQSLTQNIWLAIISLESLPFDSRGFLCFLLFVGHLSFYS